MDDGDDEATAETTRRDDGSVVIRVVGEIDLGSAETIRREVAAALDGGLTSIVFDLAGVEFIDSSGIAVLLETRNLVDSVRIKSPSEAARRILETTGLSEVLPVEP